MNEWELTDEEIDSAEMAGYNLWLIAIDEDQNEIERHDDYLKRGIADAAQKKLVGWSEGECKHDSKRIRRCCDLCWRDVRAAGGGE